jgi:hypothetical protein
VATTAHKRQGITRTIDDAVEPVLIDTGRPYSDATDAIFSAARDLALAGAKGEADADGVMAFATLIGVTVVEPVE